MSRYWYNLNKEEDDGATCMDVFDFSLDVDGRCWFDDTMIIDSAGIVRGKKGLFSPTIVSSSSAQKKNNGASSLADVATDFKKDVDGNFWFDDTLVATEEGVVEPRGAFVDDKKVVGSTAASSFKKHRMLKLKKIQKLAKKKKHMLTVGGGEGHSPEGHGEQQLQPCLLLSNTPLAQNEDGAFTFFSAPSSPTSASYLKKRHRLQSYLGEHKGSPTYCFPDKVLTLSDDGKVVKETIVENLEEQHTAALNATNEKKVSDQLARLAKHKLRSELLDKTKWRNLKRDCEGEFFQKLGVKSLKKEVHRELMTRLMVKDLKKEYLDELLAVNETKKLKTEVHNELLTMHRVSELKMEMHAELRKKGSFPIMQAGSSRPKNEALKKKVKPVLADAFQHGKEALWRRRRVFRKWKIQRLQRIARRNDERVRSELFEMRRRKNMVLAKAILLIWRQLKDEESEFLTRYCVDQDGVVHQEEIIVAEKHESLEEPDNSQRGGSSRTDFAPPSRQKGSQEQTNEVWVKV